jgi:hypothetical protein
MAGVDEVTQVVGGVGHARHRRVDVDVSHASERTRRGSRTWQVRAPAHCIRAAVARIGLATARRTERTAGLSSPPFVAVAPAIHMPPGDAVRASHADRRAH